jgi:hypothetical protein
MEYQKLWLKIRKLKWLSIYDIQPTLKKYGVTCRIQTMTNGTIIFHCYIDKEEEHLFLRTKETKRKVWYYLV